jgi:hypothetical protein
VFRVSVLTKLGRSDVCLSVSCSSAAYIAASVPWSFLQAIATFILHHEKQSIHFTMFLEVRHFTLEKGTL